MTRYNIVLKKYALYMKNMMSNIKLWAHFHVYNLFKLPSQLVYVPQVWHSLNRNNCSKNRFCFISTNIFLNSFPRFPRATSGYTTFRDVGQCNAGERSPPRARGDFIIWTSVDISLNLHYSVLRNIIWWLRVPVHSTQ